MSYQLNISYKRLASYSDSDGFFLTGWRTIAKWMRENLEGKFDRYLNSENQQIECFFELESDAMAFKLVWL